MSSSFKYKIRYRGTCTYAHDTFQLELAIRELLVSGAELEDIELYLVRRIS